jgi:hypothetical protein
VSLAARIKRRLKESRRTPTTPSLRRGQNERYGPKLIGRAEACEGGLQVRNALPAQNIVSVRYVSQLEAAFADCGAPKAYNDLSRAAAATTCPP